MPLQYTAAASLVDLVNHILSLSRPCVVLVCSSRDEFASRLLVDPRLASLSPTLQRLAASRFVKTVFVPTLSHLRAVLSDGSHLTVGRRAPDQDTEPDAPAQDCSPDGSGKALLLVVNCLAVHEPELSGQGLSRTVASAVEAVQYMSMDLLFVETCDRTSMAEAAASAELVDPWSMELPILNAGAMTAREGRGWTDKTVKASRIVCQWCNHVPNT